MPRREAEPPSSDSSSSSDSSTESVLSTPSRSRPTPAGTCTFSGPRLHLPIVRIPPESFQRLERVRRVVDHPHGVRGPGGGRLRGAYSRQSRNSRTTRQQQESTSAPRENPSTESAGQGRRRRRMKPGEKALKEIKHYQMTTELLIAKAPFVRVVRDVLCGIPTTVHRMTLLAVQALQEASEAFLIHVIEDAYLCAIHAKRKTLMLTDIKLASRLRNNYNL